MQKLKSSFACFHCFKKSKNPNLKNLKERELKENKSKSNNSFHKQIDNKRFLNEEKNILKQNKEESIKVFHQMHEELTSSKTKLNSDCHEHFQDIRSQLDQHKEKLKDKLVTYMKMISHKELIMNVFKAVFCLVFFIEFVQKNILTFHKIKKKKI